MKFPVAFRVFASLNIIAFIFLLFQSILLYYAPNLTFDVAAISTASALWALISASVWFFGSTRSYSFLPLTAAIFIALAGYATYIGFAVLSPEERSRIIIFFLVYSFLWLVYSGFILFSMFFKPVVAWKNEQNLKSSPLPITLFLGTIGFSFALFYGLNEMNVRYIVLDSPDLKTLADDRTAYIDFNHMTEFDGLAISKADLSEEFKAVISYSEDWNASEPADYFRVDTLTFTKLNTELLRSGEDLPSVGPLNAVSLFAKLPTVKARRLKIVWLQGSAMQSNQFTFSAVHSVKHFGRSASVDNYVASDDVKPIDDYEIMMAERDEPEDFSASFKPLSDAERMHLITAFLNNLVLTYEDRSKYEFNYQRAKIILNEKGFGRYENFHSLFADYTTGPFNSVINLRLGGDHENDATLAYVIEEVTGVSLYKHDENLPYAGLNPAFVQWLRLYMLPNPEDTFLDNTAQHIYDNMFRRTIWMMMASHEYLDQGEFFQNEADAYNSAMTRQGFHGPRYLYERYGEIEPNETVLQKVYQEFPDVEDEYFRFDKEIALGFWLRRKLDGSEQQLWILLQEVAARYDRYPYESQGD